MSRVFQALSRPLGMFEGDEECLPPKVASTSTERGKGVFTIPPLSEMKRANRVPVITTQPNLFKADTQTRAAQNRESSSSSPSTSFHGVSALSVTTAQPSHTTSKETVFPSGSGSSQSGPTSLTHSTQDKCMRAASSEDVANSSPASEVTVLTPSLSGGPTPASEGATSACSSTVMPTAHHPHAIIANLVQKKNPVMKYIRNVPWELGDISPDFVLGKTTCAMFLSIRYHSLHPNYIHSRLKDLGKQYQLRVLLVLVDMKECQKVLQELSKIAILADLTLMLAWSYEEAGRYLETYKAFENKPPDMLMERIDSDFFSRATESLTTVKKVNKTDAATLLNNFKTMDKVITASREELVLCPGLGPQKAQRLFTLFHQPFKTVKQDHPQ